MNATAPNIVVLIPCFNESITIGDVIANFRQALPEARIYVYDNNSSDDTIERARKAGGIVCEEHRQGKGHVVRRMFRDIDADWYVMVDGDNTYDASLAPEMLRIAMSGPYDLVNCVRRDVEQEAYRGGHRIGNRLLTAAVQIIFGHPIRDMLSGYKVFSRRFVKSFPAFSGGFDIETELTVHALELDMPIAYIEGAYRGRVSGSESKLKTYRDGFRILRFIIALLKHERPLLLFGSCGLILALVSLVLGTPVVMYYLHTGLVPRFPTAILAMGIMLLAFLSMTTGIILDTVTRGRNEIRRLIYLQITAPTKPEPSIDDRRTFTIT